MPNPGGSIFIGVTLDKSTSPWSLFVSEADAEISRSSNGQDITWQLRDMAGFAFPPITDTQHPAFKWTGTGSQYPEPLTFTGPTLSADQFTLTDHNNGTDLGPFPYQLCVTDGSDNYYTTITTSSIGTGGTNTNPKIKNR
jgi:hypothetical protein